ncbi:hypothetical protein ACFW04_008014 [Cataglyphis niger]
MLLKTMLIKLSIVLFCLSSAVLANSDEAAPRVKIPLGGLKGYYKISQNGRKYEAYEGIPYALPPIGKLRFKPPRQIPAWIGELSATKFGSPCIQYSQQPQDPTDKVEGAEDCLYLNIYVPVREKAENNISMPVLFWIHGGAFQFGSGMLYNAKYLMDSDVIFVTINYRIGPMGFLSTEDEVIPGNMGLKDQNMALRWISENIEWFDGDSNRVTLVGLSAGGASVHYHYLSKMSAGLFREFIADDKNLKQLNDNWDLLSPHFLDFNYTIPKEKQVETGRLIKKHYFGTKPIDRTTTRQLVQMASDRFFVVDSEKAARMQAKVNQNPVWYYYFTYRGKQSLSDSLSGTTENYGVSHADDVLYVLDTPWMDPTKTQQDRDMQKHLIDFWVSFATDG